MRESSLRSTMLPCTDTSDAGTMANQLTDVSATYSTQQELLASAVEALPQELSAEQRQQLEAFIPAYYVNVMASELAELSSDDLAGMALSHWQLAKTRTKSEPVHRVFNPSFDVQGWHSLHTVIQIVAADQPWLVLRTCFAPCTWFAKTLKC